MNDWTMLYFVLRSLHQEPAALSRSHLIWLWKRKGSVRWNRQVKNQGTSLTHRWARKFFVLRQSRRTVSRQSQQVRSVRCS